MAKMTSYGVYRLILTVVAVLVAAALVICVIVLAAHRGEQVRNDQSSQIAQQELKQQQKSSSSSSSSNSNSSSNANGSTSTSSNTSTSTTSTQVATTGGNLPDTGPSDVVMTMVTLALLSFSVASYVVSRRQLKARGF